MEYTNMECTNTEIPQKEAMDHFVGGNKSKKHFDYFVIIDFEGTCGFLKNPCHIKGGIQEIIEFPAILLNGHNGSIEDEFHSFCQPVLNPSLTNFCKKLTGITQDAVDKAPLFKDVFVSFEEWLKKNKVIGSYYSFAVVTDDPNDIRQFLQKQCRISEIDFPTYCQNWINIKIIFAHFYKNGNMQCLSLKNMIRDIGCEFQGRAHSGIDDARNIASIVQRLLADRAPITFNEKLVVNRAKKSKIRHKQQAQTTKQGGTKTNPSTQANLVKIRNLKVETAVSRQSLQAAAQAAAQINAQLAAEGKIQPQPQQNLQASHGAQKKDKKLKTGRKDLFNAEVEINNLPPRARNLLTKGYIQEKIQWKSKAALCTKGRYVSPREKLIANDERPLYICIQAVDKHAVDEAIHHIQDFIAEHTGSSPTPPVISPTLVPNHPPPQVTLIRDKVYINLDHAPETFKIVERVLGPSGDNVNYIQTETGVSVSLQGQGINSSNASDEPHHLLLEHIEPSAVQNARSLALSLVGTLQQDFIQWQREQQALQQQQLVYTFSQPYYSGSSTASGNFTYPAVAMVYGVENGLTQTAAVREPQSVQTHQHTRGLPGKRPSRFDYQQSTVVFPVRETARTSFHPHRMITDFLDIQRT